MQKLLKEQKGVTLIALVVTIVILIILAGKKIYNLNCIKLYKNYKIEIRRKLCKNYQKKKKV